MSVKPPGSMGPQPIGGIITVRGPFRRRVWKRPEDRAGRVALWVRWLVWAMTAGRAGALPWTWEDRVARPHHWPPPVPPTGNTGTR